jgi:hypothetical protein
LEEFRELMREAKDRLGWSSNTRWLVVDWSAPRLQSHGSSLLLRGVARSLHCVERGCFHRHWWRRRVGDYRAFLQMFVSAATLKTDSLAMVPDLSPFLAAALEVLAVNCPELFCFHRS